MIKLNYELAREKTESARNAYELASARLELASIKERLAEVVNQSEPIYAREQEEGGLERGDIEDIAFYVVIGRMPD